MMLQMCEERNGKLYSMDDRYCIDNGAMIGTSGLMSRNENKFARCERRNLTDSPTDGIVLFSHISPTACTGYLGFISNGETPLSDTTCTQRYRTDDVYVKWRKS